MEISLSTEEEADEKVDTFVRAFAKHFSYELERQMVRRLNEAGPPYGNAISLTGALAQSIQVVKIGDEYVIKMADYADYVEYGTRPHWMPIAAALRYAKLRGKDEGFAYAMRASVAKHGTKAHPFIEPSILASIKPALQRASMEVFGRA